MDEAHEEFIRKLLASGVEKLQDSEFSLKGLLIEKHNDNGLYVPNQKDNMTCVYGVDAIEETMFDNTFKVPINSFFQVHTPLAELLYRRVSLFIFILNVFTLCI